MSTEKDGSKTKYISLQEASEGTPYSQEYLSLLARKGKLPAWKLGRNWYTTRAAVDEYVRKQTPSITVSIPARNNFSPKELIATLANALTPEEPDNIKPIDHSKHSKTFEEFEKLNPQVFGGTPAPKISMPAPKTSGPTYYTPPQMPAQPPVVESPIQTPATDVSQVLSEQQKLNRSLISKLDSVAGSLNAFAQQVTQRIPEPQMIQPTLTDDQKEFIEIESSSFVYKLRRLNFFGNSLLWSPTKALTIMISAMVILFILAGGFSFGRADELLQNIKGAFKDADTLQGYFPGTHANEVLLLDKAGNIAVFGHIETEGQLRSRAPEGVAPIVVDSVTKVENLNADYLDDLDSKDFTLAFVTANGNITSEDVVFEGKVEVGETLIVKGALELMDSLNVHGRLGVFGEAVFGRNVTLTGGDLVLNRGTIRISNREMIRNLNAEFFQGLRPADFDLDFVTSNGATTNNNIHVGAIDANGSIHTAGGVTASALSFFHGGLWAATLSGGSIGVSGSGSIGDDLSVGGNIGVEGDAEIDGGTDIGGSLNVGGNFAIGGTVGSSLIPSGTFDLGSSGSPWSTIYATNAVITGLATSDIFRAQFGTAATPSFSFLLDTDTGIFHPATDSLAFSTGGVERFRIMPNGNFGIGTDNPETKFEVAGTASASSFISSGLLQVANGGATTSYSRFGVGATSHGLASASDLYIGGTLEVDGGLFVDGGFGIGGVASAQGFLAQSGTAASPSYSFGVDQNTGMFRPGADQLAFSTGGTQRLIIDEFGNVGIGVASPVTRLQVDGAARALQLISQNMLQVGGTATVSYSRFGTGTTSHGADISASNDVYISGDFEVDNHAYFDNGVNIGDSPADQLIINSQINSSLIPVNNSFDVGSPTNRWGDGYFVNVDALSFTAASTSIGGTNSDTFTINADNASVDMEDSQLVFSRGTPSVYAQIQWDSSEKEFNMNFPLFLQTVNLAEPSLDRTNFTIRSSFNQNGMELFQIENFNGDRLFMVEPGGHVLASGSLQVGGISSVSYSRFGLNATTHGLSTSQDVLISGNLEVDGTLFADGGFTFSSGVSVSGNFDPSVDNSYDLGEPALRWRTGEFGPGGLRISSTTGTSGAGSDYTLGLLSFGAGSSLSLGTSAVGAGSPGTLSLQTAGTERLFIDSSGDIGIGTNSPVSALSVYRSSNPQLTISDAGGMHLVMLANAGLNSGVIGTFSSHDLIFATSAGIRMTLDTQGNLGINTSTPQGRLHVVDSKTGTSIPASSILRTDHNTGTVTTAGTYNFTAASSSYNILGTLESSSGFVNTSFNANNTEVNLSGLTLGDLAAVNSRNGAQVSGVRSSITGSPSFDDTAGNGVANVINVTGLNSNISVAPQAISVLGLDAFIERGLAITNSSTVPSGIGANSWGISVNNSSNLPTANTTKIGGEFQVGGTATTNTGLLISNVSGATNNIGLRITNVADSANNWAFSSDAAAKSYFTGNLGIGTNVPVQRLQVHNTSGTSSMAITTDVNVGAGNSAFMYFESDSDGTPNTATIGMFGDGSLRFSGDSDIVTSPHMVITDAGNIGINTTNPLYTLEVVGTTNITGLASFSTASFSGPVAFGAGASISGNFDPSNDDVYDLGQSNLRWRDLYLGPGSIHIGASSSSEFTISHDTASDSLTFASAATNGAAFTMSKFGFGTSMFSFNDSSSTPGTGSGMINNNTLDGNDNMILGLSGGGLTGGAGRGGTIFLSGNEYSSSPGDVQILAGSTGGDIRFLTSTGGTNLRMIIASSSGNIGIGTADPQRKMHLVSGSSNGIRLEGTGTDGPELEFRNSNTLSGGMHWNIDMDSAASSSLRFFTEDSADSNGSVKMLITEAGNIGIGTINPNAIDPNAKLTVHGTGRAHINIESPNSSTFSVGDFRIGTTSGDVGGYKNWDMSFRTDAFGYSAGALAFYGDLGSGGSRLGLSIVPNSTDNPYVYVPGGLHVGNVSSYTPLAGRISISGATGELEFQDRATGSGAWSASDRWVIYNNTDVLRFFRGGDMVGIDASGNVGIGTSSPLQKLDVIGGNISVNGSGGFSIYTWTNADTNWRIGMGITTGFTKSLTTSHTQYVTFAGGAGQGFAVGVPGGNSSFEIQGSNHQAYFRGNVGIGTTTTSAKLTLNGNLTFNPANPTITASSYIIVPGGAYFNSGITYFQAQAQFRGGIHNDAAAYLTVAGGTSAITYFTGNVGIGTTNGSYPLMIDAGSSIALRLRNAAPTILFSDTDHRGAVLHNNSNFFYILSGSGVDATGWTQNGSQWPMVINMTTDDITMGGNVSILDGAGTTYLGIGTSYIARPLRAYGDIRIGIGAAGCMERGDGTVIIGGCSSDLAFKKNIEDLPSSTLEDLRKLRPVTYNLRSSEFPDKLFPDESITNYGLIAQEVESIFPQLISFDEDGYRRLSYGVELDMITIKALQQLADNVDTIDDRVAVLEAMMLGQTASDSFGSTASGSEGIQVSSSGLSMTQIFSEIADATMVRVKDLWATGDIIAQGIKKTYHSAVSFALSGWNSESWMSREIAIAPGVEELSQEEQGWFSGGAAQAASQSKLDLAQSENGAYLATYGVDSTRGEIMLSGSADLIGGQAAVFFDFSFTEVISPDIPLRVFLTPTTAITGQLVAANKTIYGFRVEELNGTSNGKFDWLVVARRKGYESGDLLATPTPQADPVVGSPTPTPEISPTPTPTPEATPTSSPDPTPTASPTASPTPTPTPEPSDPPPSDPTPTPSATPTPSPDPTPSPTPPPTPEPTPESSPTPTPDPGP